MSVKDEIINRTLSSSRDDISSEVPFIADFRTIIDYEKALMKKRSLLVQKLKNPVIYQEFMQFMSTSKATKFVLLLNIICLFLIFPPIIGLSTIAVNDSSDSASFRVCIAEMMLAFAAIFSGWLLYGCLKLESIRMYCEDVLRMTKLGSPQLVVDYLQAVYYISLVALNGLILVNRIWRGTCDKPNLFVYRWTCNPNAASDGLPLDSVVFLMFIPVLFTVVLREARLCVTISAWVLVISALTLACVMLRSNEAIIACSFYIAVSVMIAYDSFKQFLLFYFLSHQLKGTIENNQRLADQNKATEMRHLIANVAHDLKTPLSSFMTGIDIIDTDFHQLEDKLGKATNHSDNSLNTSSTTTVTTAINREDLYTFIEEGQSCIANIRNTNSFMMMMINRCLDYTKASNGLKLVPKNATIKLKETLMMPLQCMSNVQQKISMELLPFVSEGICSHIITDPQWLQENLLCLLSNAVKCSTGGTVQIQVSKWNSQRWQSLQETGKKKTKVKRSNTASTTATVKVPCTIEDEVIAKESEEDQQHRSPGTAGRYLRSNLTLSWYKNNSSGEDLLEIPTTHAGYSSSSSRHSSKSKVVPIDQSTEAHLQETVFSSPHHPPPSNPTPTTTANTEEVKTVTDDEEELIFEVIDMGIGISEEAMKALFNPFKQTQRLAGGTGLGLYSLAKRIEALEGKYGVHQRQDGIQGSVFWFTIPYKPDMMSASHQGDYRSRDEVSIQFRKYAMKRKVTASHASHRQTRKKDEDRRVKADCPS